MISSNHAEDDFYILEFRTHACTSTAWINVVFRNTILMQYRVAYRPTSLKFQVYWLNQFPVVV